MHRMVRKESGLFEPSEIVSNCLYPTSVNSMRCQISSRLLISTALSRVPPVLCNPSFLPSLMSSLDAELRRVPERVSSYVSGLSLFPPLDAQTHSDTPSLSHADNALRILDSYILGQWQDPDDDTPHNDLQSALSNQLREELVALCIAADTLTRTEDPSNLGAHTSASDRARRRS